MMHSNNEIFTRFIKFGKISTETERKKIAEIVKDWNYVSLETSNIDKKYLDIINSFVTDEKINSILASQPHLKEEFIKKLFSLLEKIDLEIENKSSFKAERDYLKEFESINLSEFEKFIKSKDNKFKKHITDTYLKKELSLIDLSKDYKNEIKKSKEKIQEIENKISFISKQIENDKKSIYEKKEKIKNLTNDPKILGKIDLKTGKPLKYKKPNETKIKEIEKEIKQLNENIKNNSLKLDSLHSEKKTIIPDLISLKNKFVQNWKKQLSLKEIQQEIEIIDKIRKEFLNELYKKIEELKELLKLLSPFINEIADLGRLWDMSAGNWQNVNFSLLEKYAQILKNKKEIQELAELLGKYRKAESELEEEEFENIEIVSKYRIEHFGKSELIGITESDDLNNLLQTELALFSDIETESIFYKRFAEKKLQTFQYINKENDLEQKSVTDIRQKEIEKDKGPFIIAVDTSGSMHGEPEFLAKVIAFAITRIAINEKRKAFLISFSTGIETFELTDIQNSLSKLIDFLQMSFHGGTDVSEAVLEALKQMKTENYEKADLLIISDGVFGNLSSNTIKSINELKKKGNKFNSLMIGRSYNEKALSFCNNIWQYDPNYNNLKDLVRTINQDLSPNFSKNTLKTELFNYK